MTQIYPIPQNELRMVGPKSGEVASCLESERETESRSLRQAHGGSTASGFMVSSIRRISGWNSHGGFRSAMGVPPVIH